MSPPFECEKTREYLDKLSMNVGVQRAYGLKSLLEDHYLWSEQNLDSCGGLQAITGDGLLRKYGPQTLNKVSDFIGRVVKEKAKGMSMKKAVQQTVIDFTKPTILKEGIR